MQRLLPAVALMLAAARCPADAGALETAIRETVEKAEPSIACILVSRSELYKEHERVPRSDDLPGRLGDFPRFDPDTIPRDDMQAEMRRLDMSNPAYIPESYGSGIVVDPAGLILTSAHVVQGATKIFVRLPSGFDSYADIHALDERSDLAVLRLIRRGPALRPLTFGDGEAVKKGQFVVALANPFAAGFRDGSPTASMGIVGNLRRRVVNTPIETDRQRLSVHHFATLIQTDARISVGSSGGALVNLHGELVGILTARAGLTGLESPGGFALPMTPAVKRIVGVLKRGEEVEYGFLGVRFSAGNAAVRIEGVINRSPAEQGGLEQYDYIRSVDGVPVRSMDDVFLHVALGLAGNTIEIERSATPDGSTRKARVTLAKSRGHHETLASNRPKAIGGLRVDYASLVAQRGLFPSTIPEGVLIREVVPDSPADRARLRSEKVITHVNGRPVTTPAEFYRVMSEARGMAELSLMRPEGGKDTVTLNLP